MRSHVGFLGAAVLCIGTLLIASPVVASASATSRGASPAPGRSALGHTPAHLLSLATITRLHGATADATAAAEFEHQFPIATGRCPASGAVVLATDATYPDALSSAYLAQYFGTGTLLTPRTRLSIPALTAIHNEGITQVYVVGGPLAVTTSIVTQLQRTPADVCGGNAPLPGPVDLHVTRISGPTEYDTAKTIAVKAPSSDVGKLSFAGAYDKNRQGGQGLYNVTAGNASAAPAGTTPLPTAIVATGQGFQDAEGASTLSYAKHLPILLTTPDALSPQVSSAIRALGIQQVIVMGGQLAVSDSVVSTLELLGVSVLRIAGATYSQTSVELAGFETTSATNGEGLGWPGTGALVVARGDWFSDGLAGAVVAASGPTATAPEPLVLTLSPTNVGPSLTAFLVTVGYTGLGGKKVTVLVVLGGPLAITPTTADAMATDADPPDFVTSMAARPTGTGYWTADSYGTDSPYGSAQTWGKFTTPPPSIVVGIAATHTGKGYWMAERDGVVAHFGDATTLGPPPSIDAPVVAIVATPPSEATGFWLVSANGAVYPFGAAKNVGTMSGKPLNRPVTGAAATPAGKGYWLVVSDGGIFSFGTVQFYGSEGGKVLPAPIVGVAPSASRGYWEVDADGNVYDLTAPPEGSATGAPPGSVQGLVATPTGGGYWIVGATGSVSPFGNAKTYPFNTVSG